MIHVFIVGSKGIPAQYGGFETFVERLTKGKINELIKYHVSCMNNNEKHFEYNNADCFNVRVPLPGAPGRILHVGLVLEQVEKWAKLHKKNNDNREDKIIVYILGCRIGPLLISHSRRLHKLGVKIFCNPDGLEWKRDKWSEIEKKFLRYCEKCLVLNSDLAICDSMNIEKYIKKEYEREYQSYRKKHLKSIYIAYGADVQKTNCNMERFLKWCNKYCIEPNEYYLIVGRFVPENNYETMINEFMKSNTKKRLVIITNVEKNKFYNKLLSSTQFDKDERIKFVGTVYDQELLKMIREEAFAYLHGHEVGGTNPSLLEALASTKLNLLLDVGFNREVGSNSVLYWKKDNGDLSHLISIVEMLKTSEIAIYDRLSTQRIISGYSWNQICEQYERTFTYE